MGTKFLLGSFLVGWASTCFGATLNFSGQLDIVLADVGGAVYSGLPIGTNFNGAIDDVTANGFISDGTTLTPFTCCIAAGALELTNNDTLDPDTAALLNTLAGTSFVAGALVDTVQLEGDAVTGAGGRIEVGLSLVLDPGAFSDENLDNYPPNPDDILVALFFIAEFGAQAEELYSVVGELDPVPLPAAIWLFGTAILGLSIFRTRKSRSF